MAIVTTGVLAAAVFITVGITGIRARKSEPDAVGASQTSTNTPPVVGGSAAAKLLQPAEIANGFALVESGPQTVEELTTRLSGRDAEAEKARLRSAGFLEGAVTIAYKPGVSVPPLTDTAVTVQILEFASPEGALAQLAHDSEGGLAAGFGISEPYEKIEEYHPQDPAGSGPPGVLLRKSPQVSEESQNQEGVERGRGSYVLAAAVARGAWEIVVELRSPNPLPIQELDRILALQVTKLGL